MHKDSQEVEKASQDNDYMSETFLAESSVKDSSYTKQRNKRMRESESTQAANNAKQKVTEKERIQEALATEITEDNKGFQMMMKMGYKSGTALGNETAAGHAIVEPIDRKGIGMEEPNVESLFRTKEKVSRETQDLRDARFISRASDFREQQSQSFETSVNKSDLRKCRSACQDLDEKHGLPSSLFWPVISKVTVSSNLIRSTVVVDANDRKVEDSEFELMDTHVKFLATNDYLRSQYCYCIWCGFRYDSSEQMEKECPGDTRADHDEDE